MFPLCRTGTGNRLSISCAGVAVVRATGPHAKEVCVH